MPPPIQAPQEVRDIAVIGMACRFPQARNVNELWRLILDGRVVFEDVPSTRWQHSVFFDPTDVRASDKTYVHKGAFIDDPAGFAALHYGIAPRRVQVMDPQQRLAIELTRQLLQDAGYDVRGFDRQHTGVFIGASVSEYKDLLTSRHRAMQMISGELGHPPSLAEAEAIRSSVAHIAPARAFTIPGTLLNMIACNVAHTFNLSGPAMQIDAACSSASVAIHEAVTNLRARQVNLAIAGGVYLNLTPDNLIGFARIGAISPTGNCRPFDKRADGFLMGEGIGLVALKRLEDAQADGDRIYAVLRGSGCNNDGRGDGPMTPRAEGHREAMRRAHSEVNFPVETIGFIEAHGAATSVADMVEFDALKQFFAEKATRAFDKPFCAVGSIKGNIGHTMSAAGVAGFIKTCLALYHRTIPPQPSCEELNPNLELAHSPFQILQYAEKWTVKAEQRRRAAVSSFGFGGTNVHLLLEETPNEPPSCVEREELFLLSASTTSLLKQYAVELACAIEAEKLEPAAVARTLASRADHDVRMAFVAKGRTQLVQKLRKITAEELVATGELLPEEQCRVAFLFTDQAAPQVDLLRDLIERYPAIRFRLERCDAVVRATCGLSILAALDSSDISVTQAHLTQTCICQAALGIALGELLLEIGVVPVVVSGNLAGEFIAASVAGMLSVEDAVKLLAQYMQASNHSALGVMAERSAVQSLFASRQDIVLADEHHSAQVVLSGTTQSIADAQARLKTLGIETSRLNASHPFHSPFMAHVNEKMGKLVDALPLRDPKIAVVSCITARTYSSALEAKDIWRQHATQPVRFADAVQHCSDLGATHFLQVGAGNTLISLARGTLQHTDMNASSLISAEKERVGSAQFLTAIGQLWSHGVPVRVERLMKDVPLVTLPPTPIETQKYWAIDRTMSSSPSKDMAALPQSAFPQSADRKEETPFMNELVSFLQQQTTVLQNQTDILKAQTEAISELCQNHMLPTSVTEVAKKPSHFSHLNKAANSAKEIPVELFDVQSTSAIVRDKILASVARISAFPLSTLKTEQMLVEELGFDSLMLVELHQDVGKNFPTLGGLPRTFLNRTTTLAQIIEHVVSTLEAQSKEHDLVPVQRYVPRIVSAPLHALSESVHVFNKPLLLTRDNLGVAQALCEELKARGVTSVLGGVDTAGDFSGVIHLGDLQADDNYWPPMRTLLALSKRLAASKVECFVTVTGLDGTFGMAGMRAGKLGQLGMLGFTKALSWEWPDAIVKAVDVDVALQPQVIAKSLVDELFSSDRSTEVGYRATGRVTVALMPFSSSMEKEQRAAQLNRDSVVLVTGALRFSFAQALGKQYGCIIALTDRPTSSNAIEKVVEQIQFAGAKACTYDSMDLRDASSVNATVAAIRKTYGKIDAVIHAAGDGLVDSKSDAQLEAMVDATVGGALTLLDAVGEDLSLFIGIGSWAGRFGHAAQAHASAAHQMLAGITQMQRPGIRHTTIGFPRAEDSDTLRRFKKAQAPLTLSDKTEAFLNVMADGTGEVLIGHALPQRVVTHTARFPVSRLNHVYLNDHTMDGQRVLPFAAALDHMAAAALESMGASGKNQALTVTDFRLKRAVFVPDTTWLEVNVTHIVQDEPSNGVSEVRLSQGAEVSYEGNVAIQASSEVSVPLPQRTIATTITPPLPLEDFYSKFTFHGPRLQGITRIEALHDDCVVGWVKGCRPTNWIKEPLRGEWAVDPLIVDASFQLAGYWAWVKHQRAVLQMGFERFVQLMPFDQSQVRCTITFEGVTEDSFTGTLVWQNTSGQVIAFMTGCEATFQIRKSQPLSTAANTPPLSNLAPEKQTIEESTWNPSKFQEYLELKKRLQMVQDVGLGNPYFTVHESVCGSTTVVNGRELINFSSYNYVGNSGNPVVSQAAKDAIEKYGTSVSASRVASGDNVLTHTLERALADFFGTEDCIVFVSGHATNVTVIGHILGASDLIVHDALAHNSIIGGAQLSGATRRPFPHNDWQALDRMLAHIRPHYRRVLIAIEGAYSMDGDIPELPEFIKVKRKHQAMLLVDEAHSAGVLGKRGRGIGEHFDVRRADVDMWMGTLSKAFASCGGYIAASEALVEYLKYTAPGFVYSVGISPPDAAAALASAREILAHPERVAQAKANARRFLELLKGHSINTGMSNGTTVVPAIIGNSVICLQLSNAMKSRGINVQPILYPAVEEDQARLRFFISSQHQETQLLKAANCLKEEIDRLNDQRGGNAVA